MEFQRHVMMFKHLGNSMASKSCIDNQRRYNMLVQLSANEGKGKSPHGMKEKEWTRKLPDGQSSGKCFLCPRRTSCNTETSYPFRFLCSYFLVHFPSLLRPQFAPQPTIGRGEALTGMADIDSLLLSVSRQLRAEHKPLAGFQFYALVAEMNTLQ
jgi:hypothetical protein